MRQKTNVLLNFIGKQNSAKNSIFLYVLSVEAKYPLFSFSFCSSFVLDMTTFHIYGYSRSSLAKLGFLVPPSVLYRNAEQVKQHPVDMEAFLSV